MESEDTAEPLTYNLPNMTENNNYTVVGWKFDWTELYGELDEGEYTFILSTKDSLYIKINFEIDDKGKIEYEIESPRKDNSDKYTTKVTDDGSGIIVVENILKDNANTVENNEVN